MKKRLFAIVGVIAIISSMFAACNSKDNKQITTTQDNYANNVDEYILEDVEVTDENGNVVLDEQGNPVTEQQVVKVTGNNNDVTGNSNNSDNEIKIEIGTLTTQTEKETETTTVKQVDNTTEQEITTLPAEKNTVPLTSDTGKKVDFSTEDQQILKQMLEVPYLYESSYENEDGVPINIASHVAIWTLQRNGMSSNTFPEGTVILNLFKYFGQTVVNYSNRCNNESSNNNIMYVNEKNSSTGELTKMFVVTNVEKKTHDIKIDYIESLGNNNYYKVVADVDGVKGVKTVSAIVQRNKLDSSLGFSVKALNWA